MKNNLPFNLANIQTCLFKKVALTLIATLTILNSFAQKTSTGGDWGTAATWTPVGVPTATDNVTITSGTVNVNVPATCRNITINGTLSLQSNNLTVTGNWINNGGFNQNCNCGGTNRIIMTGNNTSIGGTNSTTFWELAINPGAGNAVSLATTNLTIKNQGTLFLQSGIFRIGAANTLTMSDNGQQASINASGGGNFANSTNGFTNADGGTIRANLSSGAQLNVTGNLTFNNILSVADGNWQLNLGGAASRINGTLSAIGGSSWGFEVRTNPPIWGPASTYYKDRANQGLPANYIGGSDKAWTVSTGTIGVTPGYPNNVTLVNMGASNGGVGGNGWVPNTAVGLNGTLQIGSPGTTGKVSLESATSVNVGGLTVENGSALVGPSTGITFIDRGNFTLAGATTGTFLGQGAIINFAGSGTKASPQTISTTGASVTFTNMTVSNGTYVALQDPVNITGVLNLTAGFIGTSTTNSLNINSSATTAITGGSATAYVDGPLTRNIPATTTNSYLFPVGDLSNGNAYLPLTLSPNTTSGANTTVTAFRVNSGGSHDATINTISTTEYWSLTTSSPFSSGSSVSVTRPNAVSPNNALGQSAVSNGVYTSIGGSPSGNTINGGGVSTSSPAFIVMAFVPLSVVRIGGTNVTCSGTLGTVTVGGSGGTPLYQFSIDAGATWVPAAPSTSHTFTGLLGGDYTIRVRDNLGNIANNIVKVLGSVVINGNNRTVDICPSESTTLTATNLQNTTPTYSWVSSPATAMLPSNTSPSITVSPTVNPTTYTVTSTLYTNNLLTNGGFESGNTGFTSTYSYYTGGQYGTTPGNGGYYSLTNAGSNQCQYFTRGPGGTLTSLPPHSGSAYFIGDAAIAASNVWSTTANVVAGKTYKFQYWYAAANPDNAARPVMQTSITGVTGTLTGVNNITINDSENWTQATYTFAATATGTVTITLRNTTATGNTNANDFYLDDMEFLDPCIVTSSIIVSINCTLPVDLVNFNVKKHGNGALLSWSTASEKNSSHFIIQKSADGISFSTIGQINAAGNSSSFNNYSFVDPSISAGTTYYRLIQYDFDGQAHYSEIKSVSKDGLTDIQVYPNPNNGVFTIMLNNTEKVKTHISIINAIGQVVYERNETTANELSIDISPLAVGIYYLQVGTSQETKVVKIIKE